MARQLLQVVLCYSVAEIRSIPHSEVRRLEAILLPGRARYLWNPSSSAADDGANVLASTSEDPCTCCDGKGRWIRKDDSEGAPGAPGVDGDEFPLKIDEEIDASSGNFDYSGSAYPAGISAAIMELDFTQDVAGDVLVFVNAVAPPFASSDDAEVLTLVSLDGVFEAQPVVSMTANSNLGDGRYIFVGGTVRIPNVPAGDHTLGLHIARPFAAYAIARVVADDVCPLRMICLHS